LINKRKTFLITSNKNFKKVSYFKNKGFKVILINGLNSKIDFKLMFRKVYKLGYARVFFETGLTFLNTLLNYKLINNLYILQNKINLKKMGMNNISSHILKKTKLINKVNINLNDDSLYKIKF
jgi:riboflavin biosynthesis pyrimidine reductase